MSDDLQMVIAYADIRVETPEHVFLLEKGVPTPLTPARYAAALKFGVAPYVEHAVAPTVPSEPAPGAATLDQVTDAVRELLEIGDDSALTVNGTPRIAEVRKIVPGATTEMIELAFEALTAPDAA